MYESFRRGAVLEPPERVQQHPKHLALSRLVWFGKVRGGSRCLNHPELVPKHPTHLASSVMGGSWRSVEVR